MTAMYLIGCFISFVIFSILLSKDKKTFEDVLTALIFSAMVSTLSWGILILSLLALIIYKLNIK